MEEITKHDRPIEEGDKVRLKIGGGIVMVVDGVFGELLRLVYEKDGEIKETQLSIKAVERVEEE